MSEVDDFDALFALLGDFGKYQLQQYTLLFLSSIAAGVHTLSLVTVAAIPEHRCFIPEVDQNATEPAVNQFSHPGIDVLKEYIPVNVDGFLDRCHTYRDRWKNVTVPCTDYVYDTTYYITSRATEWDAVCDNEWQISMGLSVFMFGILIGAATLGLAADKYGRKPIFCWSSSVCVIVSILMAFVSNYYVFLFLQIIYGVVGMSGTYTVAFVMMTEVLTTGKRSMGAALLTVGFCAGIIMNALWAMVVKDHFYLQLIYGMHSLLLMPHWWLMNESIPWLWSVGRVREAINSVKKALLTNGSDAKIDEAAYEAKYLLDRRRDENENPTKGSAVEEAKPETESGVGAVFRLPTLRLRALIMFYGWFANSLVYYGLSLGTGKMKGDPFVMMILMAAIEVPSAICVGFTMNLLGRRLIVSAMMFLGGFACFFSPFLPDENIRTAFLLGGKFAISASFTTIATYSTEIFPTEVRNTMSGFCSTTARIGAILAPFVLLLVSVDASLPSAVFAMSSVLGGFMILFLPETTNRAIPQTIADGERFGVGETCFSGVCGRKKRRYGVEVGQVD